MSLWLTRGRKGDTCDVNIAGFVIGSKGPDSVAQLWRELREDSERHLAIINSFSSHFGRINSGVEWLSCGGMRLSDLGGSLVTLQVRPSDTDRSRGFE